MVLSEILPKVFLAKILEIWWWVGGANLVSSGVGLARPVIRQGTKKLFRNIPSDHVPAVTQATRWGLASEAAVAAQGIYDTSERMCRP